MSISGCMLDHMAKTQWQPETIRFRPRLRGDTILKPIVIRYDFRTIAGIMAYCKYVGAPIQATLLLSNGKRVTIVASELHGRIGLNPVCPNH